MTTTDKLAAALAELYSATSGMDDLTIRVYLALADAQKALAEHEKFKAAERHVFEQRAKQGVL